jgi:catechol-2,3-dioxygenase
MSASALAPVPGVMLTHGFAELTIEVSDLAALERFYTRVFGPVDHDGGDRSLYVEDLEGNVVEVWDFFERGAGRRHGAGALAGDDVQPVDP